MFKAQVLFLLLSFNALKLSGSNTFQVSSHEWLLDEIFIKYLKQSNLISINGKYYFQNHNKFAIFLIFNLKSKKLMPSLRNLLIILWLMETTR
jgi:hypothetical protein